MDREDARAKESEHSGRQGAGGKSREPREHRKRSAVVLYKGIPAERSSSKWPNAGDPPTIWALAEQRHQLLCTFVQVTGATAPTRFKVYVPIG